MGYTKNKKNTGFLPLKTSAFPNGIPIVTDRGGIRPFNGSNYNADSSVDIINANISDDLQKNIFEEFVISLSEAWKKGDNRPNSSKVDKFLNLCADNVELPSYHVDKRLFSGGWGLDTVTSIAKRYEDNELII